MDKKAKKHGTTILAVMMKDEIVLASDGMATARLTPVNNRQRKVFELADGAYMAMTGDIIQCQNVVKVLRELIKDFKHSWKTVLQQWWLTVRKLSESDESAKGVAKELLKNEDSFFLVVDKKGIYQFWGSGGFSKVDAPVCGAGCGGDWAEGAAFALIKAGWKDARKIATEAIKISAKRCVFVNGNVQVKSIKRKK